jgi:hypothetical protein
LLSRENLGERPRLVGEDREIRFLDQFLELAVETPPKGGSQTFDVVEVVGTPIEADSDIGMWLSTISTRN